MVIYSGTVVLLVIFVLVGLRAVWYCFLVVSGKSSTVLAVLYCFFNLVYELGNTKTKTKRKSPIQQLVHSSTRARSKVARAIRCSVVDIKRTVDMPPLKRIRLRSHAASELKANRSMRARER